MASAATGRHQLGGGGLAEAAEKRCQGGESEGRRVNQCMMMMDVTQLTDYLDTR